MRRILRVRQEDTELHRSWFTDQDCDLFVWRTPSGDIARFQFCYDKPHAEHVVEWDADKGLRHWRVDDGEALPWVSMTPVFVADGSFDPDTVAGIFRDHIGEVPESVAAFVLERLRRSAGS